MECNQLAFIPFASDDDINFLKSRWYQVWEESMAAKKKHFNTVT